MKMKLLFIIGMCCTLSGALYGQEKTIKQYGFWDNWFIQPQMGASYTTGEGGSFGQLLSPSAALSVGKYFSPEVGARLQIGGWQAKGALVNQQTYSWNYMFTTVDLLFNLHNIFSPYRQERKFNLVVLMGGGWNHGFENKADNIYGDTDNLVVKAGLQANFRLNNAWDLNLEGNINATDDVWNHKSGSKYDTYYNLLAGVTYKFRNRGFELVEPTNEALIRCLNEKINRQRAIIDSIRPCPPPEPCPEPQLPETTKSQKGVVLFRIGKSTVAPEQLIHVYTVANFLKEHPETQVQVTGYADAETGTPEVNQAISQKRALAVAELLIGMGISSERIATDSKGAEVQPFQTNEWNRVVIMVAE